MRALRTILAGLLMALSAEVVAFSIVAGSVTDIVVTTSFQPKLILFFWTGRSGTADSAGDGASGNGTLVQRGFGFASGLTAATQQRAVCSSELDAAATMDAQVANLNGVIGEVSSAAAITGKATLSAWGATSFTVAIPDAFVANLRIHALVLGGADIVEISNAIDILEPAATGSQTYAHGLAGTPDAVVLIGNANNVAADAAAAGASTIMAGFAKGTGAGDQGVWTGQQDDGSTTADTDSYCLLGECLAMIVAAGGNPNARASLDVLNGTNIGLNWIARGITSRRYYAIAIRGGRWHVASSTIPIAGSTVSVTGMPASPRCGFLLSHCQTLSTAGTSQAGCALSVGAWSSPTNRGSQGFFSEDATASSASEIQTALEHDEVYVELDGNAAVIGLMDVDTVNADGVTYIEDTDGGSGQFIGIYGMDSAPAPSGQGPLLGQQRNRLVRAA